MLFFAKNWTLKTSVDVNGYWSKNPINFGCID